MSMTIGGSPQDRARHERAVMSMVMAHIQELKQMGSPVMGDECIAGWDGGGASPRSPPSHNPDGAL